MKTHELIEKLRTVLNENCVEVKSLEFAVSKTNHITVGIISDSFLDKNENERQLLVSSAIENRMSKEEIEMFSGFITFTSNEAI
jgi:acid stress-induced BolA-like protein IbaG/YrbA